MIDICGSNGRLQYATRKSILTLYAVARSLGKALEDEKSKSMLKKRRLDNTRLTIDRPGLVAASSDGLEAGMV
jgi:hypothetical protein